jgi:hypothetical protein
VVLGVDGQALLAGRGHAGNGSSSKRHQFKPQIEVEVVLCTQAVAGHRSGVAASPASARRPRGAARARLTAFAL